jgi:1-acyl-sn-glycerol-3-phosphate acyltransferase
MDATYLLAKLPDAVCIFKPALLRNPAVGPAAIMAGYVSGDTGVDLIRDAARKIAAGRSLLIFPEGTRTDAGRALNPLKPGFALIAERAGAPVCVVVIRASRDLGAKGRPWWKTPRVPATVEVTLAQTIPAGSGQTAAELTASVQAGLLRRLRENA